MHFLLKQLGSYSVAAATARRIAIAVSSLRPLCAEAPVVPESEHRRKKTYRPGTTDEVIPDPELLRLCERYPKPFRRRTSRPENLYHVHSTVVELLLNNASADPATEKALIFEANPGPGILTRALLRAGIPHLRVFEKKPVFLPHLQLLKEEFPRQLEIVEDDLLRLPTINASDSYGFTTRTEDLLAGVPRRPWNHEPVVRVVGTLSRKREVSFLRFLLHMMPQRSSIFTVGRVEFLLFVSGLEYAYMMSTNKESNLSRYRNISVLYKLFFDIVVLEKVSRDLFLPLRPKETTNIRKLSVDQEHMYLLRLTPRSDLFELLDPPERLLELVFFIRQNMVKRTAYIVPTLEKWIPGCGPRLIRGGVKVFCRMGDLSPKEVVALFQLFSSLSEYQDSPFVAAMSREMQQHDDEDDT